MPDEWGEPTLLERRTTTLGELKKLIDGAVEEHGAKVRIAIMDSNFTARKPEVVELYIYRASELDEAMYWTDRPSSYDESLIHTVLTLG